MTHNRAGGNAAIEGGFRDAFELGDVVVRRRQQRHFATQWRWQRRVVVDEPELPAPLSVPEARDA
jgi:hypothetical protein